MLQSLQDTVRKPSIIKAAIRQSLMSDAGLRTSWVVVEAKDDADLYEKFLLRDTTVLVNASSDTSGIKGYANVESIVCDVKEEEPRAHIIGIRDSDYTRYEDGYEAPANIVMTDRRDLEMMLLEAKSVIQALCAWAPNFNAALAKCTLICRHFGYLRIYNSLKGLAVTFHNNLRTVKYWDDNIHDLKANWEQESTIKFVSLSQRDCSVEAFAEFVSTLSLDKEDYLDICRGHDFIPILSKALIRNHIYSEANIMIKMTEAYTMEDFKATRLYASIKSWQVAEGVTALAA